MIRSFGSNVQLVHPFLVVVFGEIFAAPCVCVCVCVCVGGGGGGHAFVLCILVISVRSHTFLSFGICKRFMDDGLDLSSYFQGNVASCHLSLSYSADEIGAVSVSHLSLVRFLVDLC